MIKKWRVGSIGSNFVQIKMNCGTTIELSAVEAHELAKDIKIAVGIAYGYEKKTKLSAEELEMLLRSEVSA